MAAGAGGWREAGAGVQGAGGALCKLTRRNWVSWRPCWTSARPPGAGRTSASRWPGSASWSASSSGWTTRWPGWMCCCIGWGGACRCRPAGPPSGTRTRLPGAGGDLARDKRTAADLGAWLCFQDESGQGLRPPKGHLWGRRGQTPVVRVTAQGSKRVSVAAPIATRPGERARLIYRTHLDRGSRKRRRKGFTETDYARLLDGARPHTPATSAIEDL